MRQTVARAVAGTIFTCVMLPAALNMIHVDAWLIAAISGFATVVALVWGLEPIAGLGWRNRMGPIVVMMLGALVFSAGAYWFYHPYRKADVAPAPGAQAAAPAKPDADLLVPKQESDPAKYQGALIVIPGNNIHRITEFPFTVFSLYGKPILTIDKEHERLVIHRLRVFDDRQNIIFRIENNRIWKAPDTRIDRPTPSRVVVFDHNDDEVLNLEFFDQFSLIIVNAVLRNRGHTLSILKDGRVVLDNGKPEAAQFLMSESVLEDVGLIAENGTVGVGHVTGQDGDVP